MNIWLRTDWSPSKKKPNRLGKKVNIWSFFIMFSSPRKAQRSGLILFFISLIFWLTLFPLDSMGAEAQNARTLVENSFNYMRGKTSVSTVEMTIHRPDWQRTMTINCWTKGQENSIFRIIAPAKDRGNGTLKRGREMWMYNPKINRVIKIPPSMMSHGNYRGNYRDIHK